MPDDLKQKLNQQFGSAISIAAVALVQFLVLCPVAIWFYPQDFSIVTDDLSFLGTFQGPTSFHAWIFNLSLIGLGSGLFWLFQSLFQVTRNDLFRITRNDLGDLSICSVTGMLTAVSLILVGLLPVNFFYFGHLFAMASWLFFTVLTLVFWLDWQRHVRKRKPTSVAKLGVIAIVAYPIAVVLACGPAMQKVIVLLEIAWFGYFGLQLRQAHQLGEVRQWLNMDYYLARNEKRFQVRVIEPLASTDRDKVPHP